MKKSLYDYAMDGFAYLIHFYTSYVVITNIILSIHVLFHRIKVLVVEENDTVVEEEEVQEVEERAEEDVAVKVEEKRSKSQQPQKNWMLQWMIIG